MSASNLNRRQFLAALPMAAGGTSLVGASASSPAMGTRPVVAGESGTRAEGNTYPILGYKRMILDYHFSEFNPITLKNANAKEIVDAMAGLGIDSLLLYSKDHWGNVYHKSTFSHRHRNVPQDLFGEVLAGLKQHGIRVIAYTTVCWDEDSARKHPDWCMVTAAGTPARLVFPREGPDTYAKWTALCLSTPYRDYFLRQMDELIANYDFDALFLDIVFAMGCYCPYCQRLWKQKYGEEIPRPLKTEGSFFGMPALKPADLTRMIAFGHDNVASFIGQVRQIERKYHKSFMLTHNGGELFPDEDYVAAEFDPWGVDFYGPSSSAKVVRAHAKGKEVELIGHRFNQLWDFTCKPYTQMRFETATAIAHNCAMMYVDQPYVDGSLDPQVYETIKKGYVAADDLVPHVKGTTPYAEIALLGAERAYFAPAGRDFAGAYEMLTELHWPFDVVTGEALNESELSKFRVLVVPNVVEMSTAQATTVRQYVERGGNLLFCYRSATLDEMGGELASPSFGLVKIKRDSDNQVSFVKPQWKLSNRYLRVVHVCVIEPQGEYDVAGTLVNPAIRVTATEWISHNVGPGEETAQPVIVLGRLGQGKFAYFAFRVFDEFVAQAAPALRESFEQGMGGLYEPSVWVVAPHVVETVFQQLDGELRLVLINGIHSKVVGGQMFGSQGKPGLVTLDEAVPVHGLEVKVRGRKVSEAYSLKGLRLRTTTRGEITSIAVPVVVQYEGIRIRMT